MANGGFDIPINGNPSGFLRAAGKVEDAIEKIPDALDDLATETKRDSEKVSRELTEAFEKASKEAEEFEKDAKESFKDVVKASRSAGDDIQRSSKDFSADSSENVKNFKEEAVQNFSEVASSFSGDMSDMADGVQGLTGGLASSLTPGIGIPVAIIGAIAASFLASWQASAAETEQRISDMYDDMLESGHDYLSADFIQKGIADIIADPHQVELAKSRAKDIGVSWETVVEAMAGDQDAIAEIRAKQTESYNAEKQAIEDSNLSLEEKAQKLDNLNVKYSETYGWLNDIQRSQETAGAQAGQYADVTDHYLTKQIEKYKDVGVEVDALGNKLVTLPDGQQIMISVETGEATTNLDNFEGDVDGKVEHMNGKSAVTMKVKVDDSAIKNYKPPTLRGEVVYAPGSRKPLMR